jgi:hypothetical protein
MARTLCARGLVALTDERLDDLSEQQVAHVCVFEVTAGLTHERDLEDLWHQHFDASLIWWAFPEELN